MTQPTMLEVRELNSHLNEFANRVRPTSRRRSIEPAPLGEPSRAKCRSFKGYCPACEAVYYAQYSAKHRSDR
jgi:hypothetical protein